MSSEDMFTPPAIIREAQPLAELAAQINACIADGLANAKTSLAKFREAGAALLRAKGKLEHGQWLGWVQKNIRYSQRTVNRYMRLEMEWAKLDIVANLENGLRVLTEDFDVTSQTPMPTVQCRECRVRGVKPNCKACAHLRKTYAAKAGEGGGPSGAAGSEATPPARSPAPPAAREPGEDPPEPPDPFVAGTERWTAYWQRRLVEIRQRHQVSEEAVKRAWGAVQAAARAIQALLRMPERPAPAPRKAKCKRCGADVIIVESSRRKPFALDPEPGAGGKFDIVQNIAEYIQRDSQTGPLYRAHAMSCKPEGK